MNIVRCYFLHYGGILHDNSTEQRCAGSASTVMLMHCTVKNVEIHDRVAGFCELRMLLLSIIHFLCQIVPCISMRTSLGYGPGIDFPRA